MPPIVPDPTVVHPSRLNPGRASQTADHLAADRSRRGVGSLHEVRRRGPRCGERRGGRRPGGPRAAAGDGQSAGRYVHGEVEQSQRNGRPASADYADLLVIPICERIAYGVRGFARLSRLIPKLERMLQPPAMREDGADVHSENRARAGALPGSLCRTWPSRPRRCGGNADLSAAIPL